MNDFLIVKRSCDYLKMCVYRERKYITKGDQVPCDITAKLIKDFNLDFPLDVSILNYQGLGLNGRLRTKILIDFRGEFLLRNGFEYIKKFISFLKEHNFIFNITRIDLATDYLNDSLTPFRYLNSIFGKPSKKMVLIPQKFRGTDLLNPTEWVQMKSTCSITFYDKSREIKNNPEKMVLYDDIYRTNQVYRCELKLLRPKDIIINNETNEQDLLKLLLRDWYSRNEFSLSKNKKIKEIFNYF